MTALRNLWPLLKAAAAEFVSDNATRLGAALAFYTALSLAPLLLLVVAIAGMVFFNQGAEVRSQLETQIQELMGEEAKKTVVSLLDSSKPKDGGVVATVIGLVTLLVGATGVFASLQDALNTVWNVDPKQTATGGFWGMLKDRLLSFSMVCGMAFLLLVSLVVSAGVGAFNGLLSRWFPGAELLVSAVNLLVSGLVMFLMFAMIFKVLPHGNQRWSDVWVGAALTTVLFAVGKYLIGLYLGTAAVGSSFGAAGSFVVLLTWLYYSSLILLFGAEFTQVYAQKYGSMAAGPGMESAGRSLEGAAPTPAG